MNIIGQDPNILHDDIFFVETWAPEILRTGLLSFLWGPNLWGPSSWPGKPSGGQPAKDSGGACALDKFGQNRA